MARRQLQTPPITKESQMDKNITEEQLREYQQKQQVTLEFLADLKLRMQETKNTVESLLNDKPGNGNENN